MGVISGQQGNLHVVGCGQEKVVPQAHSPLSPEGLKNNTPASATLP